MLKHKLKINKYENKSCLKNIILLSYNKLHYVSPREEDGQINRYTDRYIDIKADRYIQIDRDRQTDRHNIHVGR